MSEKDKDRYVKEITVDEVQLATGILQEGVSSNLSQITLRINCRGLRVIIF